ncbi:Multifunctional cyclase-dehydratase-3-O-methyl transferase TcmN [Planctomycetes bacterium Pan216]|uniref:Multifunctional cyclase-dehydratase-3-O-methyl transferase TcmN n=1 Tax=Kolteria novifilia TaxID=2527975 RepID=A0A518B985_9BACT|nr:Multifunctional cyclase-dehydratase-3-O-methyl transferase TcmN [Planctomycetes bacterium Pan216]
MSDEPLPFDQMRDLITGNWKAQITYVLSKLEISDRLHSGGKTAVDLAAETGTHARSLYRLLRAASTLGIYTEDDERRFHLTPLGKCLCRDDPRSLAPMSMMIGEICYHPWGHLLHSVRTGESGFVKHHGVDIWKHLLEVEPHLAPVLDAAMESIHGRETMAVLDAYDLSGVSTFADLGGGNGSNLAATLSRHPDMKGILFDLPTVVERGKVLLAERGLLDRCQVVGGSFFDGVPAGADVYHMRHIIHDWNDDDSIAILRACREAMREDSRVILVEYVLPTGGEPSFGKLLDLEMLVIPGGYERTVEEYADIFQKAGLRLEQVHSAGVGIHIVEGKRANT